MLNLPIEPSSGRGPQITEDLGEVFTRRWSSRPEVVRATTCGLSSTQRQPADALEVLTDVLQSRWVDEPAIEHLPPAEIDLD